MGQQISSTSSAEDEPVIGFSNIPSTVVGAFALTTVKSDKSILVEDVSGKYFTLPSAYTLQLQNGALANSGAYYLGLSAITNGNYVSFTLPTEAVSEMYGITPSLCLYSGTVCLSEEVRNQYIFTLTITPTHASNDPISVVQNLAIRQYQWVGDQNTINVELPYVVYDASGTSFSIAYAMVAVIANYTPNSLIQNLTTVSTEIVFDWIFRYNLPSSSTSLTTIRPYVADTNFSDTTVQLFNTKNSNQYGNNFIGSLALTFPQNSIPPISCLVESPTNPCNIGALNLNN